MLTMQKLGVCPVFKGLDQHSVVGLARLRRCRALSLHAIEYFAPSGRRA